MTAAAVMTPLRSSTASHPCSPRPRPSTTPHGFPQTPGSVGQVLPPDPSYNPHTTQANPVSPSYFGYCAGPRAEPLDSNPGVHTRQNWTSHGSITSASQTGGLSVEDQSRLSQNSGSFPWAGRSSGQTKNSLQSDVRSSALPSVSEQPAKHGDQRFQLPKQGLAGRSITGRPPLRSPSPLSPRLSGGSQDHHSRLSLPANHLHTPPANGTLSLARAETLPGTLESDGPRVLLPEDFVALIQSTENKVLLLDLRVAHQYQASRLHGALNLFIPTTILKRPSFNTQKLSETFGSESERKDFSSWPSCSHVAVYDASSSTPRDSQNLKNVLRKFQVDGFHGEGVILNGGFDRLSKEFPAMVERGHSGRATIAGSSSPSLQSSSSAAVAGGCPMPSSNTPMNPFFNAIRQNMELADGVGQIAVQIPTELSAEIHADLPEWLRVAVSRRDKGKLVSDAFLSIERAEQRRMQEALNWQATLQAERSERRGSIQIAGIEKGAKNRYNNIFPYDHSRVHLATSSPESCDYINANHVQSPYSNKRYIATQAPIPATFGDFWRLIWEQDTRTIVMLTAESEGGQMKSHPYWHSGEYGSVRLKLLAEKKVALPVRRTGQTSEPGPVVIVRHMTLHHSNFPFQPMREITQLHYVQWPDFGAPAHPQDLVALVEASNKVAQASAHSRRSQTSDEPAPAGQRPVLVHCSAGCGRTGTFCAVDSVLDMLRRQQRHHEGEMDVDSGDNVQADEWIERSDVDLVRKTVEVFREQRLSMVQSLRQFVLCYESVLDWLVEGSRVEQVDD